MRYSTPAPSSPRSPPGTGTCRYLRRHALRLGPSNNFPERSLRMFVLIRKSPTATGAPKARPFGSIAHRDANLQAPGADVFLEIPSRQLHFGQRVRDYLLQTYEGAPTSLGTAAWRGAWAAPRMPVRIDRHPICSGYHRVYGIAECPKPPPAALSVPRPPGGPAQTHLPPAPVC